MPFFAYTARDQAGQTTTGTLEAPSDSFAAARLREQGLWVTELRPAARSGPRVERGVAKQLWNPVPLKDLSLFYRQFHALLNSGMGMYQAVDTLANDRQTPNASLRRVIREIAPHVLAGGTLSAAMERYPWLFDRMQVRMVEAGETGGLLLAVLHRLAEYLEREYELRLEIKRKTLYPKILVAALIFIPPVPILVLQGFPAYAAAVWSTIFMVLLIGIPLLLALRLIVRTEAGRQLYDQVKLLIPVIGGLVRKLAVARFARCLAALYAAGVPITSALAMSGEATGNAVMERLTVRMVPALQQGGSISGALAASGFFQPMFLGMVSTGETSGNLDETLAKAADFYEEEAMHSTIQLTVILGVFLLLLMGIIIGIKIINFYTGGGEGGGMSYPRPTDLGTD